LERQKEIERTLIVFSSDHGEMLGEHGGATAKEKPWQPSIEVPLVIAGLSVRPATVHEQAVAQIDLAATFLDFAGVTARPDGMTSRSLRPLLDGTSTSIRDYVNSGWQPGSFAAATEQPLHGAWRLVIEAKSSLKLVCCLGECPWAPSTAPRPANTGFTVVLYNISADAFDMAPLSAHAHASDYQRLYKKLPPPFRLMCGNGGDNFLYTSPSPSPSFKRVQ